jgi:hypothetical protein
VSSSACQRSELVSTEPSRIAPVKRIPALARRKTRSSVTER